MESFENEVKRLNTLQDFYRWLDENALVLAKDHDLIDAILKFKSTTNSESEKQNLQWEIEAFMFQITGSRMFSFSYSNGKTPGDVLEYPKMDRFQKAGFDYLQNRRTLSQSQWLKARYNHLLWKSLKKNQEYATEACINYIGIIKECASRYYSPNDGYSTLVGKSFERLVGIVKEAKIYSQEAIEVALEIVFEYPDVQFWLKQNVLEHMLAYPKVFKPEHFQNTLRLFKEETLNPAREEDFGWVNFRLPTAIKIARKTSGDVQYWHEEVGDGNVRLAEQEINNQDERGFIKAELYQRAMVAYKLAGNREKLKAIEQKYFELKPKIQLHAFEIPFDDQTISLLKQERDALKKYANFILKNPPEYIYHFIGKGRFFPKKTIIEERSKDETSTFLDFGMKVFFDAHKNIKSGDEGQQRIFEKYHMYAQHSLLPFLHYLFIGGIKSGQLTAKNLANHLIKNSWIGKPKMAIGFDGKPEYTNWIHLLMPAIVEFYNQVLAWGSSSYFNPNFILCTDSLALKLEGLFRDFAERFGVSTSKQKRKGMEEGQIHDMLNHERLKKYFNDDDFLFFNYVFSSNGGLNMRNNVAHCLYNEREYHPDNMLLLLSVLFRLGKYDLVKRTLQ